MMAMMYDGEWSMPNDGCDEWDIYGDANDL